MIWGARAIWSQGDRPSLVPDRMGLQFPEEIDLKSDQRVIGRQFLKIPNLEKYFRESMENVPDYLHGSMQSHVVLLDNEDVLIECSPNASYGYLYICVSPKEKHFEDLRKVD